MEEDPVHQSKGVLSGGGGKKGGGGGCGGGGGAQKGRSSGALRLHTMKDETGCQ